MACPCVSLRAPVPSLARLAARTPSRAPGARLATRAPGQGRVGAQTRAGAAGAGGASDGLEVMVVDFEGTLLESSTGNFYKGVAQSLQFSKLPWYVLTSGVPGEEVRAAVKGATTVDLPPARVLEGSALDGVKDVCSRPMAQDPANRVHYVDNDLRALEAAAAAEELAGVNLWLASWGATEADVAAAEAGGRVKVFKLGEFTEFLDWGLLMGVNDGCQEMYDSKGNLLMGEQN